VVENFYFYERINGAFHGSSPPEYYVNFKSLESCLAEAKSAKSTISKNPLMKPGTKADFFAKTLGPKGSFVATRMTGPTHPLRK